jgi:hypothetical protein
MKQREKKKKEKSILLHHIKTVIIVYSGFFSNEWMYQGVKSLVLDD